MKIVLSVVASSALVIRQALGQTDMPWTEEEWAAVPYDNATYPILLVNRTDGTDEEVLEMLQSNAETCLPGIYGSIVDMINESESGGDVLGVMNQYFTETALIGDCNDEERTSMEQAFDEFKQCTGGLDMMAFVENFLSALLGGALRCFMDAAAEGDVLSAERWMPGSGQVLSDKCMEAMMGSNAVGDMLRTILTSPDTVFPCFGAMAEKAPMCVYDAWPMPVYGTWLKGAGCFLGSSVPMMEKFCEIELAKLNTCINLEDPNVCTSAYEMCMSEPPLSFYMLLPPFGVPLMDTCVRVAQDNADLGSGVEKYNSFVEQCTEPWNGWGMAVSDAPEVPPSDPAEPTEPAVDEPSEPVVTDTEEGPTASPTAAPTAIPTSAPHDASDPTEAVARSGAAGARALFVPRLLGRLFGF